MTTIRLDKFLNLGNSKHGKQLERSGYRHARSKGLAALIGKDTKSIYNWANGEQHFVEYDAATDRVLAIKLKAEKVVWEAK